jgi:hypothetical protein
MRVEKITFTQTFPTGQFQNQKLGVEIVVEDSDSSYADVFIEAKRIVEVAFRIMNPDIQPLTDFNTGQPGTVSDILDPHEAIRIQKLINEATTEEQLEGYYNDAERYGFTGAWDKKLKEIKNK